MRHFFSTRIRVVLIISALIAGAIAVIGSLTGESFLGKAVQTVLAPIRSGANSLTDYAEQIYDYVFSYEHARRALPCPEALLDTCIRAYREGECIAFYDKTHLFTPMGEDNYFTPGDHLCRFTLDGVSCGLIICYDVRFPELTRSLTVPGLDMLFVVSQWPKVRTFHLRSLTTARAIENQMFVVCCNSCGTAGETVYGGNSAVIDPWGETICLAGEKEQTITAECDLNILKNIRSTIPVFRDRRPELYKI